MNFENFYNKRSLVTKKHNWYFINIVISNYYWIESFFYFDKKNYDFLDNSSYFYYNLINEKNNWIVEKSSSIK